MSNDIISIVKNDEGFYEGNLIHYFKVMFNAPNACNPYHNFRHMAHVMCKAYEGAKFSNYLGLYGPRRFRALLIGAMFHDYGHSDKMINDVYEIKTAMKGLGDNILEEDLDLAPEIYSLITLTQYPHANTVLTLGAEILRDADISQLFSDVWLQQIVFGLSKEMSISSESTISPLQLLKKQISYLHDLRFYSDWGKKTFYPQVRYKIEETRALLSILEG